MDECSYSEVGVGPFGLLTTVLGQLKKKKHINALDNLKIGS